MFSLPLVEHVLLRAVLIPGFIHLFALFFTQNKRFREVIFFNKGESLLSPLVPT